jgi:hypothetical protein
VPIAHISTPYTALPLYARIAIERLERDRTLRSATQLEELLSAYASSNGAELDRSTHAAVEQICVRRFGDFC